MKKIKFHSVHKDPLSFSIAQEGVTMHGFLIKKDLQFVKLDAVLEGEMHFTCDRCSADVTEGLNEKIELLIYQGLYSGHDETYDIIEIDDEIDLDEILESEISLIKSDYHYCDNCNRQ